MLSADSPQHQLLWGSPAEPAINHEEGTSGYNAEGDFLPHWEEKEKSAVLEEPRGSLRDLEIGMGMGMAFRLGMGI